MLIILVHRQNYTLHQSHIGSTRSSGCMYTAYSISSELTSFECSDVDDSLNFITVIQMVASIFDQIFTVVSKSNCFIHRTSLFFQSKQVKELFHRSTLLNSLPSYYWSICSKYSFGQCSCV